MRGKLLLIPSQEGPQHGEENLLVLRVQGLFHALPSSVHTQHAKWCDSTTYPAAITADLLERRPSMSRIPLVLRKVMPLVLFLVVLSGTLTEQPSHLPRTKHSKTNHDESSPTLAAPSSSFVNWLRNFWDCARDPGGICPPSTAPTQPNADNG